MLYLRINTHIASLKEITGSAECHLQLLHTPNMAPGFNVTFRSALAHPGDLVKEVCRSRSFGEHRRWELIHAFLHQRQMLEIVVLITEGSGVGRAGQEPTEKGKNDTRDDL